MGINELHQGIALQPQCTKEVEHKFKKDTNDQMDQVKELRGENDTGPFGTDESEKGERKLVGACSATCITQFYVC